MSFFFLQSAKSTAKNSVPAKSTAIFLKNLNFFSPLQYRMHPAISQFPSDLFYGGRIMDGIDATKRPPPPGIF
jgi:hypothetical protein